MREQLLYYALQYQGDWERIYKALKNKEPWHSCTPHTFVCIEDAAYPSRLRRLQRPPWVLFYEGNLSLCERPSVGVIGSRKASTQGIRRCREIVMLLKDRYVIVSGLAKGIDGEAHRTSIHNQTIGVIGCGLDVVYPKQHALLFEQMKQQQLIISEYPPHTPPYACHFPARNRILAALSDALVVVEARKRSGTMITVNEALTLGIEVYCVPQAFGNVDGEGCNLLISQGANILVDEEDIRLI